MTALRCIVIDDEPVAIDILADYIRNVPFLDLTGTYRNAFRALEFLKNHSVDLVFLDINMPDLTGIQFLRALDRPPLVVFTTAYSEYALESYDYEAVDYLLKPIGFERFLKAARRALSRMGSGPGESTGAAGRKEESILVKSGTDFHRIDVDAVLYIRAAGNYVMVVTPEDEVMTLMTMKDALSMLAGRGFYRIHRSYIINFRNVEKIETDRVIIGGRGIPVGDSYREAFFRAVGTR